MKGGLFSPSFFVLQLIEIKMTLEQLNKQFGIDQQLHFELENDGFVMAVLSNKFGSAKVSIYGGQVVSYLPAGVKEDVFFLSEKNNYSPGKAIRGGTPVCWPWFGDDVSGYGRPSHGFARNQHWQVSESGVNDEGGTYICLVLTDTESSLVVWPHAFNLQIKVSLTDRLEVALSTTNTGEKPFQISQALHSYFKVSDIANVVVNGLAGKHYLDKLDGFAEKIQSDNVTVSQEIDRIYQDAPEQVVLNDSGFKRSIEITSSGSKTTVIWNPWQEKIADFSDLDKENYRDFLCIETANAADDILTLDAGESHTIKASYKLL